MIKKVDLILLSSSILWGCSWIPLKKLESQGMAGLLLVACAYSAMFVLVLPFIYRNIKSYKQQPLAFASIFVAGGLANLSFNLALVYGDVVRVMVLFYLLPVWGVLGGKIILKEHINRWRWLGLVLAVGGAFILLGGPNLIKKPPSWIDGLALLSGLMFALNNIAFRGIEGYSVGIKLAPLFAGCASFALLALVIWPTDIVGVSADAWIMVILFAVLWLFLANLGTQWAVTKMPASRSSILIITELIAAVVSAVILGGETIDLLMLLGGGLIVSATVIEVFVEN